MGIGVAACKEGDVRMAAWEGGGKERRPNEKLLPPSLSTTLLQSVMERHVDTSARVRVGARYTRRAAVVWIQTLL